MLSLKWIDNLRHRLTRVRLCGRVENEEELAFPLRLCYKSLVETGSGMIADGRLLDTLRRLAVFGLSLLKMDIRQESTRHTEALAEICSALGVGDYAAWDETRKCEWLVRAAARPALVLRRRTRVCSQPPAADRVPGVTPCEDGRHRQATGPVARRLPSSRASGRSYTRTQSSARPCERCWTPLRSPPSSATALSAPTSSAWRVRRATCSQSRSCRRKRACRPRSRMAGARSLHAVWSSHKRFGQSGCQALWLEVTSCFILARCPHTQRLRAAKARCLTAARLAARGLRRGRALSVDARRSPEAHQYLRVVPLFETLDDLSGAGAAMDALLSNGWYRKHLTTHFGDRQEVMLGYSDSGKDAGARRRRSCRSFSACVRAALPVRPSFAI